MNYKKWNLAQEKRKKMRKRAPEGDAESQTDI